MSSLSHSPYIETLQYWKTNPRIAHCRIRFLVTKLLEMYSFKKKAFPLPSAEEAQADYAEFAASVQNTIRQDSKIAVVIPCYCASEKSAAQIKRLADCLSAQTCKADVVIFVDDCSPVEFAVANLPNIIILKQEKNQGPAAARTRGAEYALERGCGIIAFTDSDCVPSKNWLEEAKKGFLNDRECSIISGKTNSFGKTWFDCYHELNGTLNGRRFKNTDFLLYGPTCNLAITADVAKAIPFDSDFPLAAGEDINFCLKANRAGFSVKYNPNMLIEHDFAYTGFLLKDIKQFRKQFERYAEGEAVLLKKNPSYYIYFERTAEI